MEITLITGGARSGKSSTAENLLREQTVPVLYVATYLREGSDEEMEQRIARHQERRPGEWETVENRLDLSKIAAELSGKILLVDCLTVWLGGCMMKGWSDDRILSEIDQTLDTLRAHKARAILVSNEVGLGIVPGDPDSRRFRDLNGWINQRVAARADRVIWTVAGIPVTIKGMAE